jgi:hypothetical protein
MPIYVPILVLLVVPAAMLALRFIRPGFAYHWLVASIGALIAWPLTIFMGFQLPKSLILSEWQSGTLFPTGLSLEVDQISWPFAVGLVTLVLAVILTDGARAAEADWSNWAGSMLLAALGVLAVLAGNPLTILLTWTALDLVELGVLLSQVSGSRVRRQVIFAIMTRMVGSGVLIAAGIAAQMQGQVLSFSQIPPLSIFLILLAAGLRLGILPFHVPFLRELPLRRGLGTMLRLVPVAASLVLVSRVALAQENSAEPFLLSTLMLALVGLASLFAGVAWLLAPNVLDGRSAWILITASLAIASAIRGSMAASMAWGLASIFLGGQIFLASIRERRFAWILWVGLAALSALPFTPTWNGTFLFASPYLPILILFQISLVFLFLGFARQSERKGDSLIGVERWVWLIYPFGLLLLPLAFFTYGWLNRPSLAEVPLAGWLVGPITVLMAIPGVWLRRQEARLTGRFLESIRSLFSFSWFFNLVNAVFHLVERFVRFVSDILEGEGGVLWALLWVVMLITLIWAGWGG